MANFQDLLRGFKTQLQTGTGFGGDLGHLFGIPVTAQQAANPNDPIVVSAQRPGAGAAPDVNMDAYSMPDAVPNLSNRAIAEEALKARQENDKLPHKGMFGIKGTLRDVLGTIGDAFLVNAGKNAVYAPIRQREREGDAMAGQTMNPLAAIERMTAVNPSMSNDMNENYQQQQLRQAQQDSLASSRDIMNAKRQMDMSETGLDRIAAFIAGGVPYENVVKYAATRGITPENLADLGITPDMSPEARQAFAMSAVDPYKQTRLGQYDRGLGQGERRLEISQQNADSQRISATRPRAGRAAPNPTAASMAAPLIRKVQNGGTLTPAEAEALSRLGYGPDKGKSSGSERRTVKPVKNSGRFR